MIYISFTYTHTYTHSTLCSNSPTLSRIKWYKFGVYFCIPNSLFCVSDNAVISALLWILGGFLHTSVNFKVDCSIYLKNFTDNLRSIMLSLCSCFRDMTILLFIIGL